MKKVLVLMLILAMASLANATVIDIVVIDVGTSGGRLGQSVGDALEDGDVIEIKFVLNRQGGGAFTSYDGYVLSSLDIDLHTDGASDIAGAHISGAMYGALKHSGWSTWSTTTDATGYTQITGTGDSTLTGISDPLDIIWNIKVTADTSGGGGLHAFVITQNLVGEYAEYFTGWDGGASVYTNDPEDWIDLEAADFGGSAGVYVVPEPITIALLGIGGLFLRRRK